MESLSAAQIKQYQEDGYLIVEIFLTEEECEKLRMRCRLLVDFSNHSAVSFSRPDTEACPQGVKQVSPWSPCIGPRIQKGHARQEVWRYCPLTADGSSSSGTEYVHIQAASIWWSVSTTPRLNLSLHLTHDTGWAMEILKMLILRTAACGFFPKATRMVWVWKWPSPLVKMVKL